MDAGLLLSASKRCRKFPESSIGSVLLRMISPLCFMCALPARSMHWSGPDGRSDCVIESGATRFAHTRETAQVGQLPNYPFTQSVFSSFVLECLQRFHAHCSPRRNIGGQQTHNHQKNSD